MHVWVKACIFTSMGNIKIWFMPLKKVTMQQCLPCFHRHVDNNRGRGQSQSINKLFHWNCWHLWSRESSTRISSWTVISWCNTDTVGEITLRWLLKVKVKLNWNNYFLPCWVCQFANLQKNEQSLIFNASFILTERERIATRNSEKHIHKTYTLICILLNEISI